MSERKTLEEQIIRLEQKQNDWFEPLQEWINEAASAAKIARDNDLFAKKALLTKIYGSNLILQNKKALGRAQNIWAARRAAPKCFLVERAMGLEPTLSPM